MIGELEPLGEDRYDRIVSSRVNALQPDKRVSLHEYAIAIAEVIHAAIEQDGRVNQEELQPVQPGCAAGIDEIIPIRPRNHRDAFAVPGR